MPHLTLNDTCPASERNVEFLQGMLNRMGVSHAKYGRIAEAFPEKVNALDCEDYSHCIKVCTGQNPDEHLGADGRVNLVTPTRSPWNGKVVLQAFWWDYWNANYPNRRFFPGSRWKTVCWWWTGAALPTLGTCCTRRDILR